MKTSGKERRHYFLAPLQLITDLDGRMAGVDVSHMVAIEPKSVNDLGEETRPLLALKQLSNSKQWWYHFDETRDWQYV